MKVQTLRANERPVEPLLAQARAHISETRYGLTVPLLSGRRHVELITYDQYVGEPLQGSFCIHGSACILKVTRM